MLSYEPRPEGHGLQPLAAAAGGDGAGDGDGQVVVVHAAPVKGIVADAGDAALDDDARDVPDVIAPVSPFLFVFPDSLDRNRRTCSRTGLPR